MGQPCYKRKTPSAMVGFEDGERCHEPKKAGSLSIEVRKSKVMDSPPGPWKKISPANILGLSRENHFGLLISRNVKLINYACF